MVDGIQAANFHPDAGARFAHPHNRIEEIEEDEAEYPIVLNPDQQQYMLIESNEPNQDPNGMMNYYQQQEEADERQPDDQ